MLLWSLQANKEVFDVASLPAAEFAASLGLPTAPRIRFLKKSPKGRGGDSADGEGEGKEGGLLKVGGPNDGRWSGTKIQFTDAEEEEEGSESEKEEEEEGRGGDVEGEGGEREEEGERGRRRDGEGEGGRESERESEEEGEGDVGLFKVGKKASLLDDDEDEGPAGTSQPQDSTRYGTVPPVKYITVQYSPAQCSPVQGSAVLCFCASPRPKPVSWGHGSVSV